MEKFIQDLYELVVVKYGYPIDDVAKMLQGLCDNSVGEEVDFFNGVAAAIFGDKQAMGSEAQGAFCGVELLLKFNEQLSSTDEQH